MTGHSQTIVKLMFKRIEQEMQPFVTHFTFSQVKSSFLQCILKESIDIFNQVRGIKSPVQLQE